LLQNLNLAFLLVAKGLVRQLVRLLVGPLVGCSVGPLVVLLLFGLLRATFGRMSDLVILGPSEKSQPLGNFAKKKKAILQKLFWTKDFDLGKN